MGEAKRRSMIGAVPTHPKTRETNFGIADFVLNIERHAGAVPCNGCNACCYHPNVDIQPGDDLTNLETELRGGKRYLKRRGDGGCVHLGPRGECTVYDWRPTGCRTFDCRLHSAMRIGINFSGDRQSPRWQFKIRTDEDKLMARAILLARNGLPDGLAAEPSLLWMIVNIWNFLPKFFTAKRQTRANR